MSDGFHRFVFDEEGSDECAVCGEGHIGELGGQRLGFVPKPPAPIRPAGTRSDPATLSGCAALLAGAGLFVAGLGFGALYLIAAVKAVW